MFGKAVLSLPHPGSRAFGSINDIRVTAFSSEDAEAFKAALEANARTRERGHRDALVYIHGYNNGFARSVLRTAQLAYDGCLTSTPIVFSWPSRGSPLERPYDEDSATFSRDAAATLLRLVRSSRVLEDIHVLAHSMGNRIALDALKSVTATKGPPPIRTAILASPDVDLDVFRNEIRGARLSAHVVVLLTSRRDKALSLAKFIAHGAPRAGNATEEELNTARIDAGGNFHIIRTDTAEIGYCPRGGHDCATGNPVVVRGIAKLLDQTGESEDSLVSLSPVGMDF
jgi:esterase/lipase superfamily enzyme